MNNEESGNKIKDFTDLDSWKYGHELVIAIYQLAKDFPKEEIFCLTNQIRRAVISVTSNIAEGFSRKFMKEKAQFYQMALGSLTETQNQLIIARDIGYTKNDDFDELIDRTKRVHKILNGLIKSTRSRC